MILLELEGTATCKFQLQFSQSNQSVNIARLTTMLQYSGIQNTRFDCKKSTKSVHSDKCQFLLNFPIKLLLPKKVKFQIHLYEKPLVSLES